MDIPEVRFDAVENYFGISNRKALGNGSFARVFGATCIQSNGFIQLNQYYAIKEINKKKYTDNISLITNEIKILRSIDHPYCMKLFDVFQTASYVYLIMEYVKGGNLFDLLMEDGPLSESNAKEIVYQLIQVLSYLHLRKIVHRDLKPENIMIDTDTKKIKLIDFGFARFMGNLEELASFISNFESTDNFVRTMSNNEPQENHDSHDNSLDKKEEKIALLPAGSLHYMAPELLDYTRNYGSKPRDSTCTEAQKEDIYALGVIVYVMLSKMFPYKGNNRDAILDKMKNGTLSFPNILFNRVSTNGIDFCRSLLEIDGKLRPLTSECLKSEWLIS